MKPTPSTFLLALLFSLTTTLMWGQKYFRIQGDFSIKTKTDSIANLTKGQFFYDENDKLIVYDISFPKDQLWIFADTSVFRYEGEELIDRSKGMGIHEFSIFSLAAHNHLSNYGLKNSRFTMEKVERQGDLVITTWEPPSMLKSMFGQVLISNRQKRLHGVVFLNNEGRVIRKQFFKDFKNFSGLEFPTSIVDIFMYEDGSKDYQITTYKNLKVNETDNDRFYTFKLPLDYQSLRAD